MLYGTFFSWLKSQFSIRDWVFDEKVSMEIEENIIVFKVETDFYRTFESLYFPTVNIVRNIVQK